MSKEYEYDLVVIGAGSGGVRLARMSAGYGARVAVIESRYLGGTCVNVGCVPKKLFVYGSHVHEDIEDAAGYGWQVAPGSVSFDWSTLVRNKNTEIGRLNGIYEKLLNGAGVEIITGTAKVDGPHIVSVGERRLHCRYIAVTTGSWPSVPDIPGAELVKTSNDMFFLERLPKRAVVWGGGYIGVEFAGILNGLGVDTTIVYRGELFLRGFDRDVRRFVAEELGKKGIKLCFGRNLKSVSQSDSDLQVTLDNDETLNTDLVLAATGRKPLLDGLGLDELGVALNADGSLKVDDQFRSSIPSIVGLGDVIGTPQLTPVAINQGMALSRNLFGDGLGGMDYEAIPTAVFCQPNIGTVGLTEETARARYSKLRIYRTAFRPMKHTLSGRDERTMMKLVVDDATDRVVGAHMVGPEAGEIIQGIAVAIKAGATKAVFDSTIGIHPTSAEEFVTMRQPVDD